VLNKLTLAVAALGSVLVSNQAQAAVVVRDIVIRNAGFEDQGLADGTFAPNTVYGWSTYGGGASSGTQNPTAAQAPNVPGGSNVGYLNSFILNGETSEGGFRQDLGEGVTAGTRYDLSVQVGRRADNAD